MKNNYKSDIIIQKYLEHLYIYKFGKADIRIHLLILPKVYKSDDGKYKINKKKFVFYIYKKIIGRYCKIPYNISDKMINDKDLKNI